MSIRHRTGFRRNYEDGKFFIIEAERLNDRLIRRLFDRLVPPMVQVTITIYQEWPCEPCLAAIHLDLRRLFDAIQIDFDEESGTIKFRVRHKEWMLGGDFLEMRLDIRHQLNCHARGAHFDLEQAV